jgi:hypothetical protein
MPKKSQISRALLPKASDKYKVKILSPTSFHIKLILSPENRPSRKAYPSAEHNITRFIDKLFQSADKRSLILEWAQDTENQVLPRTDTNPREMNLADARELFRQLLLREQSAPNVLVRLRARRPSSLVDVWEADARAVDEGTEQPSRDDQSEKWLALWKEVDGKKLTSYQRTLLQELGTSRARLASCRQEFDHAPTENNAKHLKDWQKSYNKAVRAAIRRGLQDHPYCIEWIIWHRSIGDRKRLHSLYRMYPHLERQALPPISKQERALLEQIYKLTNSKRMLSLRSIHRILVERGIYKNPWAAFHKWLKNPFRAALIERDTP